MLIPSIALILIIVIHVAQPVPSFLQWSIVNEITPSMIITCAAHAVVEEYIFRHLYWSSIPEDVAQRRRVSLVWLNVSAFWLVHVILLHHARGVSSSLESIYASTSYNVSILFVGMMLNAIYVETGTTSLINCIAVHLVLLLVWTVCFGGGSRDYMSKYKPPDEAVVLGQRLRTFWHRARSRNAA